MIGLVVMPHIRTFTAQRKADSDGAACSCEPQSMGHDVEYPSQYPLTALITCRVALEGLTKAAHVVRYLPART